MSRRKWMNNVMAILAAFGLCAPMRLGRTLPEAWEAWADGDIARARALAEQELAAGRDADAAQHMLVLCDFVSGKYTDALVRFERISADYADRDELDEVVIDAYVHLNRLEEAFAFARTRPSIPEHVRARLARHATRPLGVQLNGVHAVPFADHELADYFPGFASTINGHSVTAHIDTGGAYLVMGPDRAKTLGIETMAGEKSVAHLNLSIVEISYGIADFFTLGDVVLSNVPVAVIPTLTGASDYVIFGTCILEQFLSTLDYPNRRLILSPRGNAETDAAHRALLPPVTARVPFHTWSDHFMIARGAVGSNRELNFFVDSGLVVIQNGADGQPYQAAFTTSARKLRSWRIDPQSIKAGFFALPAPLALGDLMQTDRYAVVGQAGDQSFGGIRIDGLISHAFLKQYAWTLNFDAMEYCFASPK